MRGFWPVFKRELFAYFVTPLAYVLILAFVFWQGLHFYLLVRSFAQVPEASIDQGPVQAFFGGDVFYYLPLILICPAITMRLFAEERRSGTVETLLTAPVSSAGVVLAKFSAAMVAYAAMWAPTLLYIVIMKRAGDIDWRVVGTSYLGVFGVGAQYIALGTMMSAVARSQLVALILSSIVILGLFLLGLGEFVLDEGRARELCGYVSVWSQMGELSKGIVDSRRLSLDFSITAWALFIAVRLVESWRWGGDAWLAIRKIVSRKLPLGTPTRTHAGVSIVAAGAILVFANVLAGRHYRRWDATRAKLYTLSEPTRFTLTELESRGEDVEIFVFLGAGDPLLGSVKQLLVGYQALAPRHLVVRYLDPDRDRGDFLRLQSELDVHVGKAENGRILGDAQVVARHGKRLWYVKTDDLVVLDEGDDAKVRPRVEAGLTGAIRAVLVTDRPRVCFTTGHREASIDDPAKEGISTLKNTLAKDNFAPESVELPKDAAKLAGCAMIAVIAPTETFLPGEAKPIADAVNAGSSLLLVVPPEIDLAKKGLRPHGLADAAAVSGIALDDAVVVEDDPALREPSSLGLIFRARVLPHATTDDLRKFVESKGGEAFVPVYYVRPIRRIGSEASPLLASSPKSFALHDVEGFLGSKSDPKKGENDAAGPLDLATAIEKPKAPGKDRGARIVTVGTGTPFLNAAYTDPSPTMTFSRTLGLLWVSWLTSRPPVLDLPPKSSVQIALHLTEEDLGSIGRYVLVYMPMATALIGVAVWFRRRSTEGKRVRGPVRPS
jgi:ABC-2 type transport system permease protein